MTHNEMPKDTVGYEDELVTELYKRLFIEPENYTSARTSIAAILTTAYNKGVEVGRERQAQRAVTLFQQALGDTELPESVWKKIAKVNQLILDK